jgi:hypothetical protein
MKKNLQKCNGISPTLLLWRYSQVFHSARSYFIHVNFPGSRHHGVPRNDAYTQRERSSAHKWSLERIPYTSSSSRILPRSKYFIGKVMLVKYQVEDLFPLSV